MKKLTIVLAAFLLCGTAFSQTATATLNGSASNDADGSITGYLWKQISGPNTSVITKNTDVRPVVTNLIVGVYQFQLTVTDNQGAIGLDTVQVTVNAQNKAPHADAGPDQIIQVPGVGAELRNIDSDLAFKR